MINFTKSLFAALGCILCLGLVTANGQSFSLAGQLGFASPKGDSFVDASGEKMAGGGLAVDLEGLYHLEQFDNKIGVGLTYNSSLLFGISTGDSFEAGIYGLSLYGIKGQYRFFDTGVTPYISLGTGLSQFSTPEITMTSSNGEETVIAEPESAFSFGFRPEIGVDLGSFIISAAYMTPMKYKITEQSAGSFQISVGYRYMSWK